MTLIAAILKAKSHDEKRYSSPPPELAESDTPIKRKRPFKYAHVKARIDSSPPRLVPGTKMNKLQGWSQRLKKLHIENIHLILLIKRAHFTRGKVDSRWRVMPVRVKQYYQYRVDFLKRVRRDNLALYKRIMTTQSRVASTSCLNREWARNKRKIVERASGAFILFPPVLHEEMEDKVFAAAPEVKRPRVYIKLGIQNGAVLGEICAELFTDTCPNTCQLFLELLDGDTLGHGYVGTCFFRKVPNLYWSGGDVIYNNGFGCYAQRGRVFPIGAENYHYPHSMAGLLSMRVTGDDEMCGIFNITFKPLPQLDLRNVVFGRIIRPSTTYNMIRGLGNALSPLPVVEVRGTRRKDAGSWVLGAPNTRLKNADGRRLRRI